MALQLTELTSDAEFPPLMDALYDGYSHPYNGFWKLFKGPSAEECTARFTKAHNADPTSHWIYVTDTATGQVVGGTEWNIYESNPYTKPLPPFLATWWEEGTVMRKFSDTLLKRFMSGRPKQMNRPHLLIMWCSTHSEHRRRGAGKLMMEWGYQKADEMGLDAFVEATEAGFPLYQSTGFVTVNEFYGDAKVDHPPEGWAEVREDLKMPMHGYFMWRPKGGKYEEGITKFPWEEEKKAEN